MKYPQKTTALLIIFILSIPNIQNSFAAERKSYNQIHNEGKNFVRESTKNLNDIQSNIRKINKLLSSNISSKDKIILEKQRKELNDLYKKQKAEIDRANIYINDMENNKERILKVESEINAIDKRRKNLDKMYKIGRFRIFYSLKGRDSLPSTRRIDNNNDKVPDYIQNIALQLVHAEEYYTKVLGLTHPFKQPPYVNKNLKFIDVNIVRSPLDPIKKMIKGKAWNKAINLKRNNFSKVTSNSLMIDISSDFDLTYGVPSHELFHLFQYGYTQFFSPWFVEGTAVWAQNHFGGVEYSEWKVPKNKQQLLSQKYESSRFWSELCKRVDKYGVIIPKKLTKYNYIGSNTKIVPNKTVKCARFMRKFLTELKKIEVSVTKEKDLVPYSWTSEAIYSPDNEQYIWQALRNSME